jgi:hypothetical protein
MWTLVLVLNCAVAHTPLLVNASAQCRCWLCPGQAQRCAIARSPYYIRKQRSASALGATCLPWRLAHPALAPALGPQRSLPRRSARPALALRALPWRRPCLGDRRALPRESDLNHSHALLPVFPIALSKPIWLPRRAAERGCLCWRRFRRICCVKPRRPLPRCSGEADQPPSSCIIRAERGAVTYCSMRCGVQEVMLMVCFGR